MQNWVNVIHVYTHKIGRMESGEWRIKSGEWNSRLHKRNPPPRVEDRANGIGRMESGEWNRANGIGRMEFASTQAKPASAG